MEKPFKAYRWQRNLQRLLRQLLAGWRTFAHLCGIYLFSRTPRLRRVRRFMLVMLGIVGIAFFGLWAQFKQLTGFYLKDGPRRGGTFIEGTVGKISRINPLFPDEPSAAVASKLIFNGLTRYNGRGEVEPDLASGWQVSADGREYVLNLRDNVFWHDGKKFTAEDVVFTIKTIQNPDVRSPLLASWQGITARAQDSNTVVFQLPAAFSPFLTNLTTAILPQHLLADIAPAKLRLADFSQHPIGTGPFIFENFINSQQAVRLRANSRYVHGSPSLSRFVIRSFDDKEELVAAYRDGQLTAAGGFGVFDIGQVSNLKNSHLYEWPTASQGFAFFNTDQPIINDTRVRQALTQATQVQAAATKLNFHFTAADAPLLPEQLGYSPQYTQLPYSQEQAKVKLEAAGWVLAPDGLRHKDGQTLSLQLVTQNSDIYPTLASVIQEQWRQVGVDLKVQVAPAADLQTQYLRPRKYDVLLFGIELGSDPDEYSFWHSSQEKEPGLNLSRYKSKEADAALETGRSRTDTKLRAAKYEAFMKAWRGDAPAIALYRPDFLYAVQTRVRGIDVVRLVTPVERFYNVEDWTVSTRPLLQRTP